jgi:hypothetical protein
VIPLIATPTHDCKFCLNYHESIIKLLTSNLRPELKLWFVHVGGVALIHDARNRIVDFFMKGNYSHLFFVDSDIGFDPLDIYRLLDADKDVVCGLYPRREDNSVTYFPRPTSDERFAEMEWGATGFMCIRRNVFENLAEELPDLVTQKDGETRHMFFNPIALMGEDYSFCARWKHVGGKIFADTKARFTHQGMKLFTEKENQNVTDQESTAAGTDQAAA